MWVPWRAGSTSREQARIRAGKANRGRMKASEAAKKATAAHRRVLFRQLKRKQITPAEYRKALRKLGR